MQVGPRPHEATRAVMRKLASPGPCVFVGLELLTRGRIRSLTNHNYLRSICCNLSLQKKDDMPRPCRKTVTRLNWLASRATNTESLKRN